MKIVGYYVTKGGVPCAFKNVTGSYRGGAPGSGDRPREAPPAKRPAVAFFNKPRDAARAMNRSRAASEQLPGSLIEDWARKNVPSYFDGQPFQVWPLSKQLAGLPGAPKHKEKS